jgi:hypothetical protein
LKQEGGPKKRSGYGTWEHAKRKLADSDLSGFGQRLSWLLAKLDYFFRYFDFALHRTHDGWFAKRLRVQGHSLMVLFLPALLAVFVVFGPRVPLLGQGAQQDLGAGLVWLGASWVVLFAGTFVFRGRLTFWFQMAWITLLCFLLWWTSEPDHTAARHFLHRHLLLVFIPFILAPIALISKLLARLLVDRLSIQRKDTFREQLKQTELFQSPGYPEISLLNLARGLFSVPLYNLLPFLWLPSLLLLALFKPGDPVYAKTLIATLAWLVILTLLVMHPRLNAIKVIIHRSLFTGGPLVISIVVILLGIGRLADFQYVSTIVESGYQLPLLLLIGCAYSYFWFFEYWINRSLCEALIGVLKSDNADKGDVVAAGKIPYPIDKNSIATSVDQERRVVQIHGGARFVVVGINRFSKGENFQLYDKLELFEHLAVSNQGKAPATALEALADLSARIRFYFSGLNLLVAVGLALFVWVFFAGPTLPQQRITDNSLPQAASLERLIFENETAEHVVLLSASGGGTRAALYTLGVLNGLREQGLLPAVKLASGVSGGGATLAYFAGHRKALLKGDAEAWRRFQCTMDKPFIWDVLDGATEWRIFANQGLGVLLAESFQRRFADGGMTLGDLGQDFALILNTALAGTLEASCSEGEAGDCDCQANESFAACAHRLSARARGVNSGGRLIFTNSDDASAFPVLEKLALEGLQLNYIVVQDPDVALTTAAALNANFPPVFPNAAVDWETGKVRYWVTDGGAVENRGVLSLLFALRGAVARRPASTTPPPNIPKIHIVVAEASAGGTVYSKFPGISSKFGAPGQLGSQLMKELIKEIQDELTRIGVEDAQQQIGIHYLAMPGPLRIDGGLGTHWMLARDVRLGDPAVCGPDRAHKQIEVSGLALRNAVYGLFLKDRSSAESLSCSGDWSQDLKSEVQRIWDLLEEEVEGGECWRESWDSEWKALVKAINK